MVTIIASAKNSRAQTTNFQKEDPYYTEFHIKVIIV